MGAVAAKPHTCHVPGCNAPVPSRMLMCKPHWNAVPDVLQRAVWAAYRNGQERDKSPSRQWLAAAEAAIAAVQAAERPPAPKSACSRCGAPTVKKVRVQPGFVGDEAHSIPEWTSEWTEHADRQGGLSGWAYCERPMKESRT